MKYHNFKKVLAAFLAAALTVGSTAFVASATEAVGDITYTLAGASSDGKGGGDYVVDVDAIGGLINIGAITVEYDAELYSGVTFTPAENIVDASLFWGVGEQTAGEFTFAFSSDNADDDVADLFAVDNPSGTIAYIDATKDVHIGTLTFKFADDNTYAKAFTTKKAAASAVKNVTAQNILHSKDGYDTSKQDAEIKITNTLVFTADDFTVKDTEATYKANTPQAPSVDSSVAKEFTLALGDDGATEVINAGTYAIKVVDVSGKGYYDADEIDLGANFVIKQAEVTITAPADPEAVNYVAPDGYDLANLKIEGWNIVTTGKLNAGTYDIEVKYAGELDTANNIYIYNENEVTSANDITATVELVVNPIVVEDFEEPTLEYEATYNAEKTQTIAGYGIEATEGWSFVDNTIALSTATPADAEIVFTPKDVKNYDYSNINGYEDGKIYRDVTVTLNKAKGTGPELPDLVTEYRLKADQVGKEIPVSEFGDYGVWETASESIPGETGMTWFTLTYTPKDLDKYDYSEEPRWVASANRFEYTYFVNILPAYLPSGLVPPANPEAKTFTEEGFKYINFFLAEGWTYAQPDTEITTAGEHKNIKVLYDIPDDFTANPEDGYTVEDGKIVSYVTITVNKTTLPTDNITFTTQNSVYSGNAIEIDKANLVITGISGVDADDVTLVYEESKTAINAGTYKVYATVAATDNYEAVVIAFEVGTVVVAKADVTKDMFTVTNNSHVYDGTAKSATVTAKDGVSTPVVTYSQENPTVVGEYTITVTGDESANYKAYTLTLDTKLVIEKETIDIKIPANPNEVDYVEGGYDLAKISITNWTVTSTGKVNAGTHEIDIVYTGTFDPDNYNYTFNGTAITSAPETTVTLTVNKIALPEDVFTAEKVEAVYDGTAKEITVNVNDKYTGVGQYTIEYFPDSVVNAGKYTAIITFAEGTNYLGLTFELADIIVIAKADVVKEDITLANTEYTYDGTAKKATATAKDGMGVPTVTGEGTNAGSYTVTVAGDETTNYNAYSFTYENALVIKKADVAKADITVANTEYTYDGTAKKATATAKDGVGAPVVTGEGTNAGTYTFTVAGDASTNYNAYSFTYENALVINKADVAKTDITLANTEFTYDGTAKKATATAKDGVGAPTVAGEGTNAGTYTVTVTGEATDNYNAYSFTYDNALVINKAALPADAATATAKSVEYTGSAITVYVALNAAYNGLGEFTVAYPDGNINVGTYDVTATFTEGDNYLGGTVTFTNALTITKQVLQNISGPTFDKTEAIVGEEIKNDAGEGFKFAEDYVIKEGNNEIKVTKTIDGDFAKNYDYTVAAEKVGLTVSIDETTGDVTLTKTFNVIGKYATGTVSLKAIAIDGAPMEGITVTVTPEKGEATTLTFTTNENEIIVDKAELTAGKYTIKVKMLKYLEYTINFTLEGGAALDLGSVDLIAGDIVGGPAGQETFGDGVIDIDDFVIAIRAFDTESSDAVKNAADINGDRANNVTDLGYIKANFNKTTADCTKTID